MGGLDLRKYTLAFLITAAMFGTAFYIAARLNDARVADIRTTQDQISLDILSTETQYDLLGELDCDIISASPILTEELNNLALRLSVAEENLGADDDRVRTLKKQYTLLELKDYILMRKISDKCGIKPVSILYFYSNEGDCPDCGTTGDVLTYLRQTYPGLRVYAFDYNLDLGALKTLLTLRGVKSSLPAFIINNRAPVYGFRPLDEMEALIPELKTLATTTPAASAE